MRQYHAYEISPRNISKSLNIKQSYNTINEENLKVDGINVSTLDLDVPIESHLPSSHPSGKISVEHSQEEPTASKSNNAEGLRLQREKGFKSSS